MSIYAPTYTRPDVLSEQPLNLPLTLTLVLTLALTLILTLVLILMLMIWLPGQDVRHLSEEGDL